MADRKESIVINKALGKRYFLIEKAKMAGTVGLLVGTLGAANYLEIIERMKTLLSLARKKYYCIVMGKLNPAKLANFTEVDVFVLVSCPENSLISSQEFYRPIITPFELEVACTRTIEWGSIYSTDYQEILSGGPIETNASREELKPEYSFVSGELVFTGQTEGKNSSTNTLAEKSPMDIAMRNNEVYLQSRKWKGLEQKLGESTVHLAMKGESGTPRAYSNESGEK